MSRDFRKEQQRKDLAAHLAGLQASAATPPKRPKPAIDIPHASELPPPAAEPPPFPPRLPPPLRAQSEIKYQPAAPAVEITCPYCSSLLAVPPNLMGSQIACSTCQGVFQTEIPRVGIQNGRAVSSQQLENAQRKPNGAILPCVIISLIGSGLGVLVWLSTVFLFFMAVIPLVLGIFEIIFLCRLGSMSRREAHQRARNLAILEIVLGLVSCGNLLNIICGAIILGNSSDD